MEWRSEVEELFHVCAMANLAFCEEERWNRKFIEESVRMGYNATVHRAQRWFEMVRSN